MFNLKQNTKHPHMWSMINNVNNILLIFFHQLFIAIQIGKHLKAYNTLSHLKVKLFAKEKNLLEFI